MKKEPCPVASQFCARHTQHSTFCYSASSAVTRHLLGFIFCW